MVELIICTLIYLITVIIMAIYVKKYECTYCSTLGELLNEMSILCFIPGLNTVFLIVAFILMLVYNILKYMGIVWLWNKLMNIKL